MEHYLTHITAAVVMTAAAVSAAELGQESTCPALPCPALNLPLIIENDTVKRRIEGGMIDLLLGWEEHARVQFAHAIEEGVATGNTSLMAYCGMMLACEKADERDANRMLLQENIDSIFATPVEIFYLSTFLKLMSGEIMGAADDFALRSSQYKRDKFSALWACMLYHCSEAGYDILGRPNRNQARALELASSLYNSNPQDALVCYVRAYIEEAAPNISGEALEAARKSTLGLPNHPMPRLLYGHLLYRMERAEEAIFQFKKAVELSKNGEIRASERRLQMIAELYEATALWSAGKTDEALQCRRAMNSVSINRENINDSAEVLRRWEANTLPLRVLVLREKPPGVLEIRAAANAATPKPALEDDDPVLLVRDCLRSALYARARMRQNDSENAQKSLQLARESFEKFQETQQDVFKRGNHYITPWFRAEEACRIAILAAGADVFPDADESWKNLAEGIKQPANMLMPPPLPKQFKSSAE